MEHSKQSLLLGVVYTRRDLDGEYFCNSGVAGQRKKQIEAKLQSMKVDYINIDFLNEEGILLNGFDAEKVASVFLEKGVDALFCPHLNFGCEDAIAKVSKLLDKPVLIWGPRDSSPDTNGNRCTDSQCGLFATGKVLRQFGVPFSYMTSCTLEDPTFSRVFCNFLAAAQVVKGFRHMRIGQIGVRPETFWSVKCNELQLLEQFGIEVVPITMLELENLYKDTIQNHRSELSELVDSYQADFDSKIESEYLYRTAALNRAIRGWADSQKIDGIASSCWGAMRQIAGISSCFTFAELTNAHLPVVCEMDIHGAITSVLAQSATRWQKASFLADVTVRHPTNENAELFWHCGVFPRSTASKSAKPVIGHSFDEGRPSVGNFLLENGTVTISRFDCSGDRYQLLMAEGTSVPGPKTTGTYGWFEFKDWPKLEHKIVYGPYIHHCVGIYDKISPILYEACKYIPGLEPDPTDPTKEEIEAFLR
ncbi:MAG: fucose isomerase [Eubacteriales bacterium]|nr:fucose isomerase [Eubacteriales bacterium]